MDTGEIINIFCSDKEIIHKYICSLCHSEYTSEEDAERCFNQGIPDDLPDEIDIEIGDKVLKWPTSMYIVTGICLDEGHKKLECEVKSCYGGDIAGKTMKMDLRHAINGIRNYNEALENKNLIEKVH